MIKRYKVLTGGGNSATEAAVQLSERVNHAIAEGWDRSAV